MTLVVSGEASTAPAASPRRASGGYRRYVAGKIAGSLGSVAFVLVVNFFLFRVLPGDTVPFAKGSVGDVLALRKTDFTRAISSRRWNGFMI